MKKFHILAAGMFLCGSAMAQQPCEVPGAVRLNMKTDNVVSAKSDIAGNNTLQRLVFDGQMPHPGRYVGAPRLKQPSFQLPTPDDAPQYIQETPAGTLKQMVKGPCWAYGYNWMVGQLDAPSHGCLVDFVYGEGGKEYIRPVYSLVNNNCWLVGDTEGDEIVFKFPQVANHYEYPR